MLITHLLPYMILDHNEMEKSECTPPPKKKKSKVIHGRHAYDLETPDVDKTA